MEFLHSSMDHPVSQRCRIYQLQEIRIKASETPDELVEQIQGLANRCNFPTDIEKERHIQFRMVHALSDTDLIRKLLVMKIEATTAEMLAVCRTHIAITDNMSSMGLSTKAVSAVQKMTKKASSHSNPCGNCTSHSRKRALPSKGLYLPLLPEDQSLEAEVQEVRQGQGCPQETQVTTSTVAWTKKKGR